MYASVPLESPWKELSNEPLVAHSTKAQPAHDPTQNTWWQSPTTLANPNPNSTDRRPRNNHPQKPPPTPLESPRKGLSNEPLVAHPTEAQQAHAPTTHNTPPRQSPTALVTLNSNSTDHGPRNNHTQKPPLVPLESPWKGLSNKPLNTTHKKSHPRHEAAGDRRPRGRLWLVRLWAHMRWFGAGAQAMLRLRLLWHGHAQCGRRTGRGSRRARQRAAAPC
eukprot:scaffold1658_cov115-Isochrysis_galbana.AAC.9